MQPLAIPQLSSPIDAGDAGSAGTPQSNNGSGVVFNELMSAANVTANERRATDEALAARRAADLAKSAQEDRDTQNAVAALSAAAQFAANNVRLKQRAAAEQLSHEEASRRATEEKAAAQQSKHSDDTAQEDEATTADSATLPELSADQTPAALSLQNNPTATQSQDTTEHGADEAMTSQASTPLDGEEKIHGDLGDPHVGILTGAGATTMADPSALNEQYVKTVKTDQAPTQPEKNGVPASNIGALEPGAMQPSALQNLEEVAASTAQPNTAAKAAIPAQTQKADAETQAGTDKPAHGKNDENDNQDSLIQQPQPVAQTSDTSAITALVATPEVKNSNTTPIKTDPVLAPQRAQITEQSILQNQGSISNEPSKKLQTQNRTAENANLAALDRGERQKFATEALDIRSVSKFETEAPSSATDGSITPMADVEQTTSTPDEGRSQLQKTNDQGLITALKTKTDSEPNLRTNMSQMTGESVSLGELEKLGVKDFSVQVEPSQIAPPPTPEPQAPPAPPTPTQAQMTGATTPNSGPNTERRTIAADIRLRALERMVVAAARAGTETLTLQLYPPALGQVMIRLVMDGQRLRIVTRAANAEAVNTLKNMEADIRDALTGHGLDLADFDVSDESQEDDNAQRQQQSAPARQTSNGKKNETFIVDLNA